LARNRTATELMAEHEYRTHDAETPAASTLTFDDGAPYRVEIASVEGPEALREVVRASKDFGVRIHRISQGSGIMMLMDQEIREMVAIGRDEEMEVCLFVGPRASWDVGVQASTRTGMVASAVLRGADQLRYGMDDVLHACELGIRSVLVADLGQLRVIREFKEKGHLPDDLIVKTSVSLPAANPATARVLRDLGATTLNLPVDLSLGQMRSIRDAVDCPLDLYIEAPDDLGGTVRLHEIPEIVRTLAPVHLKFAVRNAPPMYPSGVHTRNLVLATARERVRRAALGIDLLRRQSAV
jgi:Peptidase family U32